MPAEPPAGPLFPALVREEPRLAIIGRERALIDRLTRLLSDAAGGYHERTSPVETARGCRFDVRIFEGKPGRGEPSGRIARVTVELDRLEEEELRDWQYEVANGDTLLGFEEWKQHQAEAAAADVREGAS